MENYLKQIRKNGYNTKVKQATHQADFVGRPPLLLGGNSSTGGACWFCYSHSSYYGEVPEKYLKDENGYKIDKRGNRVSKEVENPYLDDFYKKWKDKNNDNENRSNPSLPILIQSDNKIKR